MCGPKKANLYFGETIRQQNAGWIVDFGLEIKHDPCWGVVARVFLSTRASVNLLCPELLETHHVRFSFR
jgi:hypothetical protein